MKKDNFIFQERFRYDERPSFKVVTIPRVPSVFEGGEIPKSMEYKEHVFEWDNKTEEFIDRFQKTKHDYYMKTMKRPEHIVMNVLDYMQYVLFHAKATGQYYGMPHDYALPTHHFEDNAPIVIVKEGDIQFVPHWSTLL